MKATRFLITFICWKRTIGSDGPFLPSNVVRLVSMGFSPLGIL